MRNNILVCPGEACPLRMTCRRFSAWLDSEDNDRELEMIPDYKTGTCTKYIQKEFYGQ